MPADLPPGALEDAENWLRVHRQISAETHPVESFSTWIDLSNALTAHPDAFIALAREALTLRAAMPTIETALELVLRERDAYGAEAEALRERVAGLTASLDACQAGHTHQAKRAEAAEAEAARLRAALEELSAAFLMEIEAQGFDRDTGDCPVLARAYAALRPAASCQGSLDDCPTEKDPDHEV